MRQTIQQTTTAAIVIAALAGTCATVSAGSDQKARDGAAAKQHDHAVAHRMIFLSAEKVLGAGIINANDESLGSVDDLILDRGTGRVEYVVLSKGGVLGIGSKEVAIPFASFDYDYAKDKFRLNATLEYIENAKQFAPKDWVQLESGTWDDQFDEMYERNLSGTGASDPYASGLDKAEKGTVKGRVTDVRRERTAHGAEQIVVTVDTTSDGPQRAVLGPAWFVMSQPNPPMRGDTVEVHGFRLPRDGQSRLVARDLTIDGKTTELRNEKGAPRWDATDSGAGDKSARRGGSAPMILLSDLIGMDARARDKNGGEIDGAIIEMESGTVAILLLDPDENVLGIGDELRCVPWPIAAVGRESVRIDADKDMLLASQKVPSDVRVFSTPARLRPVYEVYRIDVVQFAPRDRRDWSSGSPASHWTGHSDIGKAFKDGRTVSVLGTIESTRTMNVPGTSVEALAVQVRTADRGTETVVLGPRWFLDRQPVRFEDGATITIDAKAVTINGQRAVIAESVTTADGKRINLWNGESPAWASR